MSNLVIKTCVVQGSRLAADWLQSVFMFSITVYEPRLRSSAAEHP